jgi:predicted Rossmann fold flavoprotein
MKTHEILIIGAGASGLFLGSKLQDRDIAFVEANSKIGLKILASGGGKCNVTNKNVSASNYLGDKDFIKPILNEFSQFETLEFLKKYNIELELRKFGQYFCKNSARDLVELFKKLNKKSKFYLDTKVLHVEHDEVFKVDTSKGLILTKKLVVASGGISYKQLGASDIGYEIAKSFSHSIVPLNPALVGLTVQKEQFWMKELSGISFDVMIKVKDKTLEGDLLFTHKGISGPVVLSSSLYWDKGKIIIDFLPHVKLDEILNSKSKKLISSSLPLPKRFMKSFLSSILVSDKPIIDLNIDEKEKLYRLKNYELAPAGNFGYTKAEVTKGGVSTKELTLFLESKLQKNLYFIGEVLNVTGELGGYNFQWAFASANRLANHI